MSLERVEDGSQDFTAEDLKEMMGLFQPQLQRSRGAVSSTSNPSLPLVDSPSSVSTPKQAHTQLKASLPTPDLERKHALRKLRTGISDANLRSTTMNHLRDQSLKISELKGLMKSPTSTEGNGRVSDSFSFIEAPEMEEESTGGPRPPLVSKWSSDSVTSSQNEGWRVKGLKKVLKI